MLLANNLVAQDLLNHENPELANAHVIMRACRAAAGEQYWAANDVACRAGTTHQPSATQASLNVWGTRSNVLIYG